MAQEHEPLTLYHLRAIAAAIRVLGRYEAHVRAVSLECGAVPEIRVNFSTLEDIARETCQRPRLSSAPPHMAPFAWWGSIVYGDAEYTALLRKGDLPKLGYQIPDQPGQKPVYVGFGEVAG